MLNRKKSKTNFYVGRSPTYCSIVFCLKLIKMKEDTSLFEIVIEQSISSVKEPIGGRRRE